MESVSAVETVVPMESILAAESVSYSAATTAGEWAVGKAVVTELDWVDLLGV